MRRFVIRSSPSPSHFHVLTALGNVEYRNLRSGEQVDCQQSSNGQLIVDDDIEIIETDRRISFILIVEKDTVFQVANVPHTCRGNLLVMTLAFTQ